MSAAPDTARDPDGISAFQRLMITVSVMLASSIQVLDTTIAYVALPHMQGALSASQDQISWVLTSYIVVSAIGIPLAGWLAERYGRRRILLWNVAGFTLASMFCGMAETLPQMVVARALQGALGAGLMPLPQAVIMDCYPARQLSRGLAIYSIGVIVAPVLGPTLGGLITDTIGWRWLFYINVPLGVLSFLGILTYVPRNAENPGRKLDVFGFAMLSLAIGLLQAMLDRGQNLGWFDSTEIRVEMVGAVASFAFFVVHTWTVRTGSFLNVTLVRNANFVAGLIGFSMAGGIMSATRALYPSLLQNIYLYNAMDTGLILSPAGLGSMLMIFACGRWADRFDPRFICLAGFVMMSFSLWRMTGYDFGPGFSDIAVPNFIQGMGLVLITVPLMTLAFATLSPDLRNEGSAFYSLSRSLGGSLGISITQAVLSKNSGIMHASLGEHITHYASFAQQTYSPVIEAWDATSLAGLELLNQEVTRQAAMVAYLDAFQLMMMAILATTPVLLLIRRKKEAKPPATP